MEMPEIRIAFERKASSAIRRGSRGVVAVILKDETKEQFLTPYRRWGEVKAEDWDSENLKLLKMAFTGEPQWVFAVRLLKKVEEDDLAGTLEELKPLDIDYVVWPGYTEKDKEAFTGFLKAVHEKGKKAKAVLPSCEANDMHVINFATERVTVLEEDGNTKEYTAAQYCCRIAGILAGLPLTQSSTYYVLDEVVDCVLQEDADAAVDAGKLVVVFDGEKYKLGRGVTSLTTATAAAPEDCKKIKIVEGMDVLRHDIYSTFEDAYVGKVANSYDNKQMFVGAVNSYLASLVGSVLDGGADNLVEVDAEGNREYLESHGVDTADMTEQELKEANTGSWLFLRGSCRFLDAMEDLELLVYM